MCLRDRLQRTVRAREHRNVGFLGSLARLGLVTHQTHRIRTRADESEAAILTDLGEVRILREKTVPGMNRVDVGDLGGADDRRDAQVAVGALGRPNANRLVSVGDMQRVAINSRMHRDRLDA